MKRKILAVIVVITIISAFYPERVEIKTDGRYYWCVIKNGWLLRYDSYILWNTQKDAENAANEIYLRKPKEGTNVNVLR